MDIRLLINSLDNIEQNSSIKKYISEDLYSTPEMKPHWKRIDEGFIRGYEKYLSEVALTPDQIQNIFKHVILNKDRLIINAISEQIKQVYVNYGFPANKINVLHNGAREDCFKYHDNPLNHDKSIYLAKIEDRKKQYIYQQIPNIDFVGNYHNSSFDISQPNYLGEWKKDTLYNNLSYYGNLILLSDGEADPLVVKEALICGLGVVVSECASANLDLTHKFITIIPNDKLHDILYVNDEVNKNRKYSIKNREKIREYGLKLFSWKNVINKYNQIIL